MTVIDTRSKMLFAYGHIPGTINIQNNNAFSNWAGWLLDYDEPVAVICGAHEIDEITRKLMRIGLDNLVGYFTDIDGWIEEHPMQRLNHIEPHELEGVLKRNNAVVVDVRGINEYNAGHIKDALHIQLGDLPNRLNELDKDKNIIMHCAGGDRSSTACSILQKHGFKNVINLAGGYGAWMEMVLS